MSDKFSNASFIDRVDKWWWDPDKFSEDLTGDIAVTLQYVTMSAIGTNYSEPPGDINASLEEITCEMYVGSYLDATIENITANMQCWLTKLWPSLEPLTFVAQTGAYVDASLQPIEFEGYGGAHMNAVDCTFQYLTSDIRVGVGEEDLQVTLLPLDVTMLATNTFNGLEVKFERLKATMYTASSLVFKTEELEVTMVGTPGNVGYINAKLQKVTADFLVGRHLRAKTEYMTSNMSGTNEVLTQLIAKTRRLQCTITGGSDIIAVVAARLRYMQADMDGLYLSRITDDIEASLRNLRCVMNGRTVNYNTIEATLRRLKASMVGNQVSENELDATLEEITASMLVLNLSDSCEAYGTLEFGE